MLYDGASQHNKLFVTALPVATYCTMVVIVLDIYSHLKTVLFFFIRSYSWSLCVCCLFTDHTRTNYHFVIFRLIEREMFFVTLSNANHHVTMVVFVTLKSIQCKYFDEVTDMWEASGCSVINSTADTTVCRCNRIAQFGLSEMPISTELSFQNLPVRCYCFIRCLFAIGLAASLVFNHFIIQARAWRSVVRTA